jgi:N-acetylneuraminate synthase
MNDIPSIEVSGRRIAIDAPPFLIAELSANHNGRLETALAIIDAAKAAGADAVKIQTYRPDTITLDAASEDFRIRGGPWDGRTLFDLYREAHLPWEWHSPLFAHARKVGITMFSSPFDTTAVDLLEDLGAPAYKIASFEAVDPALIRYAAGTGKPLIISTGMADADEIGAAIQAARDGGCTQLAILHCVSGYPAPPSDYNLRTLSDMSRRFGVVTGLSDHTLDSITAIGSVAMGASLVEKHFTLDRCGGGPDDSFSVQPAEFAALCRDCRTAWEALGSVSYGCQPSESGNLKFRRSLYFVRQLEPGDLVTSDAVRSVRPGYGLAPKFLGVVLGARVVRRVFANTPVVIDALDLRPGALSDMK